ncbi:MAG: EAL domain-containing protein, partial [Gaiellaceae bacterium]|nr:EAL domain-containing protein [Gaiellaceae bacterium]
LAHQAFHDPLTGLANRALFAERLEQAVRRGLRRPSLVAVLFLDLDDFKTANDSLGHAAGDELLVAVANRIRAAVRPEDTCARLGGDEFAVLIEGVPEPDPAIAIARRILSAVAEPVAVSGAELTVQGSVGIAFASGGESASEVMRSADLAMYRAKAEGKGRYAVYAPSMHERALRRLELKAELRRAVETDELEVHYQPIVELRGGEIVGVEALVRWRHPRRGLVLPGDFLDVADETGLIVPLGRRVLRRACEDVAAWRRRSSPAIGVSVNVSARELASRHLIRELGSALEDAGLDAGALTLEITESTLLDSHAVAARLEEVRRLGVRIAIDDFGTGYASLNYLQRFPVDTLKIAKQFVDAIGTGPEGDRLAAAIVRLGATMDLATVAEGIEHERQRDRLRALGCRYGQGHLFFPPLRAAEVEDVLPRARVA